MLAVQSKLGLRWNSGDLTTMKMWSTQNLGESSWSLYLNTRNQCLLPLWKIVFQFLRGQCNRYQILNHWYRWHTACLRMKYWLQITHSSRGLPVGVTPTWSQNGGLLKTPFSKESSMGEKSPNSRLLSSDPILSPDSSKHSSVLYSIQAWCQLPCLRKPYF